MRGRILVTGGQGLVGRAVANELIRRGERVRVASRQHVETVGPMLESVRTGELGSTTDWATAISGVDAVVHCAARVHVMDERAVDPLEVFRSVNTAGTLQLARQCAEVGVQRFIFISSVKVNGEATKAMPFAESDLVAPLDPYGISKHEAEVGLRAIADASGMAVVIIRPPLIYGPGVKANFAALMRAVRRGVPLPFGAVKNQRSLLALDNLTDFIFLCLQHRAAANETFLLSDGVDLSTPDLIRELARACGVAPRLIPVPPWVLSAAAGLFGKADAVARLCGNLQIDSYKARHLLGWSPPVSFAEGVRRAVAGMDQQSGNGGK